VHKSDEKDKDAGAIVQVANISASNSADQTQHALRMKNKDAEGEAIGNPSIQNEGGEIELNTSKKLIK